MDDEVLPYASIYVESREAAFKESGDVIAAEEIVAEVGEVISGAKPGRRSAGEVTLIKSLGLAVEDVATAELVYRKALERRLQSRTRLLISSPRERGSFTLFTERR